MLSAGKFPCYNTTPNTKRMREQSAQVKPDVKTIFHESDILVTFFI